MGIFSEWLLGISADGIVIKSSLVRAYCKMCKTFRHHFGCSVGSDYSESFVLFSEKTLFVIDYSMLCLVCGKACCVLGLSENFTQGKV